jgi:hypothetical protein
MYEAKPPYGMDEASLCMRPGRRPNMRRTVYEAAHCIGGARLYMAHWVWGRTV